jgi:hypothetical protein
MTDITKPPFGGNAPGLPGARRPAAHVAAKTRVSAAFASAIAHLIDLETPSHGL